VTILARAIDLPRFVTVKSARPEHRQLCLHTCGLGLSDQQLEGSVKALVRDGQSTKAAGLAIIHGQPKLAIDALRSGESSSIHRELSLALAGYTKGRTDSAWNETVSDLAEGQDDPYARAILALVREGDWKDVLNETSLPLQDRVGIALMYLEDDDLSAYVSAATEEAIIEGDIEGVVLTGLTERAIPLFETYIHKFADLQTAVLALSFASPRFFADQRVIIWRETYRTHLNRWRMFIERARLDMQCTKLSTPSKGRPTLIPTARQVTLRCNCCEEPLDRSFDNPPSTKSTEDSDGHYMAIFGKAKSGTVCPKCERHMPRCAICMNWLGMPDPHTNGAMAAAVSKNEALSKFVSVCRGCWHMSHGSHAEEWFARHEVCPVPRCNCRCAEADFCMA